MSDLQERLDQAAAAERTGRLAALREVRETINHERKREAMNAREGRIYRNMRKIVDALIEREEGKR